jgi:hypothetical protein
LESTWRQASGFGAIADWFPAIVCTAGERPLTVVCECLKAAFVSLATPFPPRQRNRARITPTESSGVPQSPFLICPDVAAGKSQDLQFDLYLAEGRYKSGLVQGSATYAGNLDSSPNEIRLTTTGTLKHEPVLVGG